MQKQKLWFFKIGFLKISVLNKYLSQQLQILFSTICGAQKNLKR